MEKYTNDPLVCYLIVNASLMMSAGKSAAQVGHAVGMIYEQVEGLGHTEVEIELRGRFMAWRAENYRKVVLKADEKEWEKLKSELYDYVLVQDAGYTEVESGSETCIGLFPMRKSEAPKIIRRLQTLK